MIPIKIQTQPDDTTCGPTSLHAIYQFYGDPIPLVQVIKEVTYLKTGGTLAVLLGNNALQRGYKAHIYTYNLHIFDPTWFKSKKVNMIEKLQQQAEFKKHDEKLQQATVGYIEFLKNGGKILFQNLTPALLRKYFQKNIPILTGLSATYLYQMERDYTNEKDESVMHDTKGYPSGHFVVLAGYDDHRRVIVADPYEENPLSGNNYYAVNVTRLINSIMLGIVTFDANILIIEPGKNAKVS